MPSPKEELADEIMELVVVGIVDCFPLLIICIYVMKHPFIHKSKFLKKHNR